MTWKTNRHDVRNFDEVQVEPDIKERNNKKQNTNHTTQGDTTMSTNSMFSRISITLIAVFLLSSMQQTFAAGTYAGTTISNQAQVSFNDGSTVRNRVSNLLNIKIRQTIAGSYIGGSTGSSAGLDHRTVYFPISFTNTGNQYDWFQVSFTGSQSGFSNYRLFVDNDNSGTVTAGDDSIFASGVTAQIDTGIVNHFLIAVDVDATPSNLDSLQLAVTLTSQSAVGGSYPTLGDVAPQNEGEAFTYNWTYKVNKPVVTWSVAQTNPSPAIPGASGSWLVTYENTGSADVNGNSTVTITLPSQLQGSSSLTAATHGESAVYTDNGSGYAGSIDVTIPAAALANAVGPYSFTVPFTIEQISNNGTGPAGTASVTVNAGDFAILYSGDTTPDIYNAGNPSNGGGLGTALPIDDAKGAMWKTIVTSQAAGDSETVEAVMSIKNMGNTNATFDFTQVDSGGTYSIAHYFAESSMGTEITTTSAINPGDTLQIFVKVTTPSGFTTGNTIKRALVVTSNAAGTPAIVYGATDTITITTNYSAPTLTISLAASNSSPAPGDTIEFTLTLSNTGASAANNVVVGLPINSNMTFLTGVYSGSDFTVDGTPGSDGGKVLYSGGSVTTTSAFSVPTGSPGQRIIKYKCSVN